MEDQFSDGLGTVDKEWVLLMITAKHMGITIEEVERFLLSNEDSTH